MNPQLVDTGKVYSIKPEDRKGDFTFTRSSAATRVNADGNIEKETQNLLLQSNQFDTTWTLTGATSITGGQVGYDGTNDAWILETSSAAGSKRIQQSVSVSGVKSYSVYAKAGTSDFLVLGGAISAVWFNLSSGVVGANIGGAPTSIESMGNGWYRCTMTEIGATSTFQIYVANTDGSTSTAVGDNIYIQDAQLEQGLVARDVITTTTAAVEGGITDNVPRLDYTDSSCPALLLEPQRTNALPNSEYFGTGYTLSNVSLIENDAISPEGLQNATKIYPTSSGNYRNIRYSPLSPATGLYTYSIFAKAGELDHLVLIDYDGSGVGVDFNLSTGVATNSATTPFDFVGMVDYGNGWYRCIATATDPYFYWILSDNGAVSVTANGTDGLYIWGAQAETASYATSYIPTYGTSVTRNGDACSKTGVSDLIGQTEGTLFAEFEINADNTNGFNRVLAVGDGTSNNRIFIFAQNTEVFRFYVANCGAAQVDIVSTTSILGGRHKVAFAYKANDFIAYVDGVQVGIDTSGTIPSCSNVYIGTHEAGSTQPLEGGVNQALLFKTRLSNEELAALTTI